MTDNYCNNCGKHGHNYNQCKLPITSLGAIAFRYHNNNIEYLMIRRKDTLGFIDFIRGKYSTTNKDYLMNMIKQMTIDEKHQLLNNSFDQIWSNIWGNANISNQYKTEENSSKIKFNQLRNGIHYKNQVFTLNDIVTESFKYTHWDEPEWGFPKGRRNFNEADLNCALREFTEETGFNMNSLKLITKKTQNQSLMMIKKWILMTRTLSRIGNQAEQCVGALLSAPLYTSAQKCSTIIRAYQNLITGLLV